MSGAGSRRRDSGANASRGDDMIVLDQDGVEEPGAVVATTAAPHGILLEKAQPWRRLARIDNICTRALERIDIAARERRDAAHAAEEVQGDALSAEDCPRAAGYSRRDLSRPDPLAVLHMRFKGD